MNGLKKISLLLICWISIGLWNGFASSKPVWVHNSLKDIDTCEGKVKLTLVKIWGDEDTDDENQYFRYPKDIKISPDGDVFILDSGNNRIQVYDRKGTYKRTIGRRGQGKGDILRPKSIELDKNRNVIVLDSGNNRIQTFDRNGIYLGCFRTGSPAPSVMIHTGDNKLAALFLQDQFKGNNVLTLLKPDGTVERKIGKPHFIARNQLESEAFYLSLDKYSYFYLAFWGTPLLRKLSKDGDSILNMTFEVAYKCTEVKINPITNEPSIKRTEEKRVEAGLALDGQSRIFLVVAQRDPNKSERIGFVSDGSGNWVRSRKTIDSENTDRFRLLVFNTTGKIIAASRLNVFCDSIYIYDDNLFIIDSNMGMKIYEYKITLP